MSAQAVLSIVAPAHPATRSGSSDVDASGFQGLLAAALSGEGGVSGGGAAGVDVRAAEAASGAGETSADDANQTGAAGVLLTPPPVVPAVAAPEGDAGSERQVLPGEVTATGGEPLVLSGAGTAKDAEPLVLPGTAIAKEPGPQVLPGAETAKGTGPLVLPDEADGKDPQPQLLPGEAGLKGTGPQVVPCEAAIDITLPISRDGEVMEEAPSGNPPSPSAPEKQGAAPPPALPPLRALAERTSEPLDEAAPRTGATPADGKAVGPAATPTPVAAQVEPPVRSAAPPPLPAAVIDTASAPTEAAPAGDAVPAQTEAAAPARDHSLSTLSRASIDATAQIAAQILRKLEGRSTRFEIALKPAELGRVDVKLDIDSEGRLAARLAFDNPAAAADLRGRADELRRQLEAVGFQMADDAFEFAERDSGSSAFDRGQDAQRGQNRAFATAARLKNEIDVAQPPRWLALSLSPSGVDMKV
jgi:hypothetical protein